MRGSFQAFIMRKSHEASEARRIAETAARNAALAHDEAEELKRARIMNRTEPGYERKDGEL